MKTIIKEYKLTYLLLQKQLLAGLMASQGKDRKEYKAMIDEAGEVYQATINKLTKAKI